MHVVRVGHLQDQEAYTWTSKEYKILFYCNMFLFPLRVSVEHARGPRSEDSFRDRGFRGRRGGGGGGGGGRRDK